MARPAGKEFVSIVLNVSGNRVGLVNYSSSTRGTTPLGNNSEMLKSVIDSYTASGWTCICCGVNSASSMINSQSNTSRRKSMLVMSDGQATEECSQQGTTGDLNGDGHADWPEDDAIQSACDAKNNRNITVYTVGFGTDVDTNTLQLMADCGGGRFFNATNMTELLDVYKVIASEISNMSYDVQTIEVLSENSPNMVLFPDSYIKIDYIPQNPSYTYGEISQNFETPMFGGSVESPKTGNFTVPNGTSIISSRLISYSGKYWTSVVELNSQNVYNLSAYNTEFYDLGDPYSVIMPASLVNAGNENTVSVDTGSGENNMTGGSPDSKVIYTASIKSSVGYAGVFYDEDEAKEDAKERLQGLIANYSVTGDITVDSTNAAGIRYLWGPTEFKIAVWR